MAFASDCSNTNAVIKLVADDATLVKLFFGAVQNSKKRVEALQRSADMSGGVIGIFAQNQWYDFFAEEIDKTFGEDNEASVYKDIALKKIARFFSSSQPHMQVFVSNMMGKNTAQNSEVIALLEKIFIHSKNEFTIIKNNLKARRLLKFAKNDVTSAANASLKAR